MAPPISSSGGGAARGEGGGVHPPPSDLSFMGKGRQSILTPRKSTQEIRGVGADLIAGDDDGANVGEGPGSGAAPAGGSTGAC